MTSRIYIKLSVFLLLLLLFSSCGEKRAPQYDDVPGSALLDACDAILAGQDQKALEDLAKMNELSSGDAFAEEASLSVKRRQYFKQIRKYLDAGDFQALKLFLMEKEATGEAGADMMEYKDIPDALQALTLFVAKMPWESSEALKSSLEELNRYKDTLSRSKAFLNFYAIQQDTLARLLESERQTMAAKILAVMERAVVSGKDRDFYESRNELKTTQSKHIFFVYETAILNGKPPQIQPGTEGIYAIALAGKWEKLTPTQRNTAAKQLAGIVDKAGICGKLVSALSVDSLIEYEMFFESAKNAGMPVAGKYAVKYLKKMSLPAKYFSAWCWRTPCLGVNETIARLQQFKTTMPPNKSGNKQ